MRRPDGQAEEGTPLDVFGTDPSSKTKRRRTSVMTLRLTIVGSLAVLLLLFVAARTLFGTDENILISKSSHGAARLRAAAALEKGPASMKQIQYFNMTLDEFGRLAPEDRADKLIKLRSGSYLMSPTSNRLHGVLGLGDDGARHWKPKPKPGRQADMAAELRHGGGFNLRLSDAVPLDRDVVDSRHKECQLIEYDMEALQDATIIIVFYNEPFSTLFRSVHSVLNMTPPSLLREIVLVDDGSEMEWIKEDGNGELEAYIQMLPKVRLVRLPKRRGIVAARMAGIRAAEAPIFVILDSHIEAQKDWLQPLVQRIGDDRTRVLMPQVDGMDAETLTGASGGIGCTLGFLWKMIEHGYTPDETSTPSRRDAKPTDFVTSPTMAGGLFAANVDFFLNDLGGYDELFEYWGTENLELSFRLWMCGGVLECAPCSRVFHIFRKGGVGYTSPAWSTTKNKLRTIAVWMDEYADLAWRVIGKPTVEFGPYDQVLAWKKEKGCKNFQWFMDEVWPESFVKSLPGDVPYMGPVVNEGSHHCLDLEGSDPGIAKFGLHTCHGGGHQEFMYFSRIKHIMPVNNDEVCMSEEGGAGKSNWCFKGVEEWTVEPVGEGPSKLIVSTRGKCLTEENGKLVMRSCDKTNSSMLWTWPNYNPPKVWTPPPNRFIA